MGHRILMIEDDRRLAPLVRRFLEDHHFDVRWKSDGDAGWAEFQCFNPDMVLLDLMLPGRDGLDLCRQIRESGDAGILILTAKGEETDRVIGLELGADDYLTKPFSLPELLARIRAILRRCGCDASSSRERGRRIGPFTIDPGKRTLARDGRCIPLTRTEFDMLDRLTRRPGRVFCRDELLDEIRGGVTVALYRAVDSHISNLRGKLEADPKSPEFIQTVWGVGYKWAE